MTTEFSQLALRPELVQAVAELGYDTPMPIQAQIIPAMLDRRDVIGQAQTGTGKTAAFALPILQNLEPGQNFVQALVLAPTRELALQVAEAFRSYSRHLNARVLTVYGGAPYGPQIAQLKRGVEVVVGTPGRIIDLMEKGVLDIGLVRTVVLDEADEMLSMGFIEDMEKILAATSGERQTSLFSATMPAEIRRLADRYLRDPHYVAIKREQVTGETIEQSYYLVNAADKVAALTRLFEMEEVTSALIFVRTRSSTADLANELTVRGFPAEALSGDLTQDARERTMARFRQKGIQVLVATDVAARGLDIDDISHVFNFDLPEDPEVYVHRIGRTGRAGKSGKAITLVTPGEKRRLGQIESFARQKITRSSVPTEEEIRNFREQRLVGQMLIWLRRGRYKQEREMIAKLMEEGHDLIEIAAAALKMARAGEKQRPIEPVSEVIESRSRERMPVSRGSRESYGRGSHEEGMVRLSLNLGKKDGIRPNDIVGAIAADAGIPGSAIGKIRISDRHSLVDVPEAFVPQVLSKSNEVRIRRQPVEFQRA